MEKVVELNNYKYKKELSKKILKFKTLLLALKQAYLCLHPFLKYPIVYKLVEEIMVTRVTVRRKIVIMKKQLEEK